MISCKAQQEYPITTSLSQVPTNSYIKDQFNSLNSYVGAYKTIFNGNEVTIDINKEIKREFTFGSNFKIYKDALIMTFSIKNSNGQMIQNTVGSSDSKKNFIFDFGFNNTTNSMIFYYTGTNCSVGHGEIQIRKLSSTQISWSYFPNSSTLTSATCPGNPDLNIYLPRTENLIFTKQ